MFKNKIKLKKAFKKIYKNYSNSWAYVTVHGWI